MIKRLKGLEEENRRLKKIYAEERFKVEILQKAFEGIPSCSAVTPSERREMVIVVRRRYGISIRFACHCLHISVATYYYKPKLSAENQRIADCGLRIADCGLRIDCCA